MNEKKNSSIVYKLNAWHLSQVFLNFVWINIVIVILFSASLFYSVENTVANLAKEQQWTVASEEVEGIKLPNFIDNFSAPELRGAKRQIVFAGYSFWGKIYSISYRVFVPYENSYYVIDYNIGNTISIFLKLFIALMVLELLNFLGSIGKSAKSIRIGLKPIEMLTETARSMSENKGTLLDLKGTIETINAADLDTRIKVSSSENELKDLAASINGLLDRINMAYMSQVRFVSDASHELRTPIAVIQGYANLLDRWGKNDEQALDESIKAIKSEAEGMKELIEQLLFLARGDNNTMQLNLETINISFLVSEVIKETMMLDKGHEFETKTDNNIYILGDAQLIKQAIRIFVDNSIKYTPTGGLISAKAEISDGFAKVIIQDEGYGIPSEDLPHVFDRFYRSDESRARETGGTGLGLSIAKWIIERHRGSASIISRVDIGTRITVSFMLSEQII